jgi:2-oxoglutarate dehydrogenase E1 component
VVQGIVRAKIDTKYQGDQSKISSILIHGDAAVAAQGVVYEVIQMSNLKGYGTGGTIHVVINNQIGFTTNYLDARSSTYCTDIAKVTLSPVFHVNGDDVEALVHTIRLAMEFRQRFKLDVFIDLLCYRKYGHNEGDEPRFTQPLLYKAISTHPNPREVYSRKLMSQGKLEASLAKEAEDEFKEMLQERLLKAKQKDRLKVTSFKDGSWKHIRQASNGDFDETPETAVKKATLIRIAKKLVTLPEDKPFFNKTLRLTGDREKMIGGTGKFDWAMGELMAYGTLVDEGFPVRVSGQDVERGTFSHRHAALRVEDSEEQYMPLNHIREGQAPFNIFNSLLSEYGVLGFDYGYGLSAPDTLTVWEAQFGDFGNGAQIIFDQYMSCAEQKWMRMNGIVVLLPHGYEGQGAEHSSARMERFLALCAQNNMQVVNCTTPANFFHVLRRQIHRDFRKPLIVFTPKSLLRHPKCVSATSEFTSGGFNEVIDDHLVKPDGVTRVIFCTGKIYYELDEFRQQDQVNEIALIRLEQIYPFPQKKIGEILKKYSKASEHIWVQEEPENMGAWSFILRVFDQVKITCISRNESATPATGSYKAHEREQKEIIKKVFDNILITK